MKEKDLKIKQKQDMLKVKKQQKEPLKVRPALQQKMKADYIRGKACHFSCRAFRRRISGS